jgi:hypothetical protein
MTLRTNMTLAAAMLMVAAGVAMAADSASPVLGLQLTYSSDMKDIDQAIAYDQGADDTEGGGGWIGPYVGVTVPVADALAVEPRVSVLFNAVSDGEETSLNTLVVPAVVLKGMIVVGTDVSMVLGGGLNYGVPNIDSEFDVSNDGVGMEAFLGCLITQRVILELGYASVPAEAGAKEVDLGGGTFRVGWSF